MGDYGFLNSPFLLSFPRSFLHGLKSLFQNSAKLRSYGAQVLIRKLQTIQPHFSRTAAELDMNFYTHHAHAIV